jgi:hypothetical protein
LNRTIEVIVSPKGETRIETKGFTGTACRQASQSLEEALGLRQNETLTAEFYQQEAVQNRIQQGGAP